MTELLANTNKTTSGTIERLPDPLGFLVYLLVCSLASISVLAQSPFNDARGMVLRGTVVTMDGAGTILHNGNVLVRNGKIVATWEGPQPPAGTPVGDATVIDLGPKALIFPGLINLHNHPTYNVLHTWPAPSSHVQPSLRPDTWNGTLC